MVRAVVLVTTTTALVWLAAIVVGHLVEGFRDANANRIAAFRPSRRISAFHLLIDNNNDNEEQIDNRNNNNNPLLLNIRGGASDDVDEDESDEESEEEEEEEEDDVPLLVESDEESEEEELLVDAKLTASAVKSSMKTKSKMASQKTAKAKKAVNTKLTSTKSTKAVTKLKKKKSSLLLKLFAVPYIVRACTNPVTLYKMTIAYWKSLFNLDYLKNNGADPSQDLRSALEEKSKKGGGSSPKRGKRKMKRGQAKTLSDLPQLSS